MHSYRAQDEPGPVGVHAEHGPHELRYCPSTELDSTNDPNECPRGSEVGSGTASAALGSQLVPRTFDVQIFAGARNELGLWLQASRPPMAKAVRGVISRAGSPYYQKITVDIPTELQRHLGSYVYLTGLSATVGATRTARVRGKRRRYHLVTTVGCPANRKHQFQARARFVSNPNPPAQGQAEQGDTSACTGKP